MRFVGAGDGSPMLSPQPAAARRGGAAGLGPRSDGAGAPQAPQAGQQPPPAMMRVSLLGGAPVTLAANYTSLLRTSTAGFVGTTGAPGMPAPGAVAPSPVLQSLSSPPLGSARPGGDGSLSGAAPAPVPPMRLASPSVVAEPLRSASPAETATYRATPTGTINLAASYTGYGAGGGGASGIMGPLVPPLAGTQRAMAAAAAGGAVIAGQVQYRALLAAATAASAKEAAGARARAFHSDMAAIDAEIDAYVGDYKFEQYAPEAALVVQTAWRAQRVRLWRVAGGSTGLAGWGGVECMRMSQEKYGGVVFTNAVGAAGGAGHRAAACSAAWQPAWRGGAQPCAGEVNDW